MNPAATNKRARISHDVLDPAPPLAPPSRLTRVPTDIMKKIFEFSCAHTFARCYSVSKTFKTLHDEPAMQTVFCGLLGIVPSEDNTPHHNREKAYDAEFLIREFWTRPQPHDGTLTSQVIGSVKDSLREQDTMRRRLVGRHAGISCPQILMQTAQIIQKALSASTLFSTDLEKLILRSPPQDTLLPFFLLSPLRRDHEKALTLFGISSLACKLVFHLSDIPTCGLLAGRFRLLRPTQRTPQFLEGLFTAPLYAGSEVWEWLMEFKRQDKELPASFLTETIKLKQLERNIRDKLAYQKAVNDRVALLLEFGCNVDIDTLIASVLTRFQDGPLISQENLDILVARFNASKPTPKIAQDFYTRLGGLSFGYPGGWCDLRLSILLKPVLTIAQAWLKKNGFPPNADTLLTSLMGATTIVDEIECHNFGTDFGGVERILDFHCAGTDPSIIPTRRIMLLIYFIQMSKNAHFGRPSDEINGLSKISGWLRGHRFPVEDFEKHLVEFIGLFPLDRQMKVISFVLNVLDKRTVSEAIFNVFPNRFNHPEFRKWRGRNGLISYPGMLSPAAPRG